MGERLSRQRNTKAGPTWSWGPSGRDPGCLRCPAGSRENTSQRALAAGQAALEGRVGRCPSLSGQSEHPGQWRPRVPRPLERGAEGSACGGEGRRGRGAGLGPGLGGGAHESRGSIRPFADGSGRLREKTSRERWRVAAWAVCAGREAGWKTGLAGNEPGAGGAYRPAGAGGQRRGHAVARPPSCTWTRLQLVGLWQSFIAGRLRRGGRRSFLQTAGWRHGEPPTLTCALGTENAQLLLPGTGRARSWAERALSAMGPRHAGRRATWGAVGPLAAGDQGDGTNTCQQVSQDRSRPPPWEAEDGFLRQLRGGQPPGALSVRTGHL